MKPLETKNIHSMVKQFPAALLLGFLCLPVGSIRAQAILNIQGANMHTEPNSLMHVNGDVSFTDGKLEHNGVMEITGNWSNTNQNNNEAFDPSSSGDVKLITGLQEIQGFSTTAFPTLSLEGWDTKRLLINTKVTGKLNLNDLQLDVRGNDMWVTNPATDAITRTSGYVNTSNHPEGRLVRNVTANSSYYYPMGGGTDFRYRPVNAVAANDGVLAAQFQNYDPNNDGYMRSSSVATNFNVINDKFYHSVTQVSGIGSADIKIPYSTQKDGSFNGLAKWDDNKHWTDALYHYQGSEAGPDGCDMAMHYHMQTGGTQRLALTDTIAHDDIFVVTGFTPNGDGKNDYFVIKGLENYKSNELKIFNRWGRMVYTAANYRNDWAGNGLDMDTYMYLLKVKDMNGKERVIKGDVTLIR
ncbi:MAG: gliding motility-associated C-terminal domain-containing protein [Bacteroidetes bacterium]|nr:gliding motility-associated C-terminal domain-containing protein [Bacteroidota bacterium]